MSFFDELLDDISEESINTLHSPLKFVAGETQIPVTGKVFGKEEIKNAIKASAEFWLTAGPYTQDFESKFAKKVGMRHSFMVNSGSSANLLALTSLTSSKMGERQVLKGDEVITVASGFPTSMSI